MKWDNIILLTLNILAGAVVIVGWYIFAWHYDKNLFGAGLGYLAYLAGRILADYVDRLKEWL